MSFDAFSRPYLTPPLTSSGAIAFFPIPIFLHRAPMMTTDGYHRSKLSEAMFILASADDIGTRLEHTFNTLTNVRPDGFSDRDLGDRYERLIARLTDKEAEAEEDGAIKLTLRAMSEQEAADAAHEIVEIYLLLLLQAKSDLFD